jgi:sortase A
MNFKNIPLLLEQMALLFASFVWTLIVLAAIALFWAYQDLQERWEFMLNAPPEALAQALPSPFPSMPAVIVTPSPTPWAGPPPTITPSPTKPPTPTATRVIPLPEILPETLNPDDPTPVIVHNADEAENLGVSLQGVDPSQAQPVTIGIQPTPEPAIVAQPTEAPNPEQVVSAPPTITPLPPTPVVVVAQPPTPVPVAAVPPATSEGLLTPTRLVIESVGIDSKINAVGWNVIQKDGLEYSIWEVADYAVGWHKTSALLGRSGNTVMAGHHNVNGEVFRDLVNVERGDKIVIYAGNQRFEYQVDLKTIVKEKGESAEVRRRNAQWIAPTDDERITLVTCWPYTNNTHRVIVVAKPL